MNGRPPLRKKSLPAPTTFLDFGATLILHGCRKYLLYNVELKLLAYALLVLFGSFVRDFVPLPNFWLCRRQSALNQLFVKWSWAWTLAVLGPFMHFSSLVLAHGNRHVVVRNFCRLLVSSLVWFLVTKCFVAVADRVGLCSQPAHDTQLACLGAGGRWRPFDISGHTFLLAYIALLVGEEGRLFIDWPRIRELADDYLDNPGDPPSALSALSHAQVVILKRNYLRYTTWLKINFVLLAVMNFLAEVSLTITVFYYHTAAQKFVAFFVAFLAWYGTYKCWYQFPATSPGLPGFGCGFVYQKTKEKLPTRQNGATRKH